MKTILEAQSYAAPFEHLRKFTLPYIAEKAAKELEQTKKSVGQDQTWLKTWWQHFRSRPELIGKIAKLERYIVCSRVTKRPVFIFVSPEIRPGDALSCFVFEDDFSFGVLQSNAHWEWFIEKCSKMKSDFRYTPESVFDTFPWPRNPSLAAVRAVAAASLNIRRVREETLEKIEGGLRAIYRTLEIPGNNPLKDAHADLDSAVLTAYGFNSRKDILTQLLDLNQSEAALVGRGEEPTKPGVPGGFQQAEALVSGDFLRAPQL